VLWLLHFSSKRIKNKGAGFFCPFFISKKIGVNVKKHLIFKPLLYSIPAHKELVFLVVDDLLDDIIVPLCMIHRKICNGVLQRDYERQFICYVEFCNKNKWGYDYNTGLLTVRDKKELKEYFPNEKICFASEGLKNFLKKNDLKRLFW
jgi:hypothetical protein